MNPEYRMLLEIVIKLLAGNGILDSTFSQKGIYDGACSASRF